MKVIGSRSRLQCEMWFCHPCAKVRSWLQPQICINILCQVPYLLFTPYHLMLPPIRAPPSSCLFLATIYNQS